MAKSTGKAVAAKCKSLETELSVLNRSIKNHPNNDKLYYSKAVALKKLAEITGNKEQYIDSLTSFNKAIEMNPENAHYIIKRAELFVGMHRNQEAFSDLQVATKLAKDILDKPLGALSIEEMATVNAIRDIEHKAEPTPEQASVVFHLPKNNEATTTAPHEPSIIVGSQPESNECRLLEIEEQASVEIVGAAENYNICPYCGY